MQHVIFDRASHKITRREYTDEGFLRVPANVARTGVQEYLARELGLGGDPNRVVKVYRPPSEVFSAESLASFDGADVTNDHPSGLVTSENFKQVSAGFVSGAGRIDGDFVQCDLIIKDKAAIDAINAGKCELSAGYTAIYDERPGVTPDGEHYDFVQRAIKINHVALVNRARAGFGARVFDNKGVGVMPVIITIDSGRQLDVADTANAQLVADSFNRLSEQLAKSVADADAALAIADARAEELEAVRLLASDEAIAERVKAIAAVQSVAAKIAGEGFTCDSVDILTIQREALAKVRPSLDWSAKSEVYIQAAFDMQAEMEEEEEEEPEEEKSAKAEKKTADADTLKQLAQLAQDASAESVISTKPVLSRAQQSLLVRTGKGA